MEAYIGMRKMKHWQHVEETWLSLHIEASGDSTTWEITGNMVIGYICTEKAT